MFIICNPKLPKKIIWFIVFIFATTFRYIFQILLAQKGETTKYRIQKRCLDIICNVTADLLVGIHHYLSKLKSQKESEQLTKKLTTEKRQENKLIFNQDTKINPKKRTIIILIIATLDFACQAFFLFYVLYSLKDQVIERKNQDFVLIIDIISRYGFSLLFLDTYFYRHHTFSMILYLIIAIIFLILEFEIIIEQLLYLAILLLQTICYSLEDVLNKVALTKYYLRPSSLIFFKGRCQIIFVFLTFLLVFFQQIKEDNDNNFFSYFQQNFFVKILRSILYIASTIARTVSLVLVIDKFSSPYISVLKVMESCSLFIVDFIYNFFEKNDNNGKDSAKGLTQNLLANIGKLICFLILFLTSLVYNEIVIINICGLQEFTQYELDIQAEKDLKDAITVFSQGSGDSSITSLSNDASFNSYNSGND